MDLAYHQQLRLPAAGLARGAGPRVNPGEFTKGGLVKGGLAIIIIIII